jgi:two-component sensor histidine kinase
LVLVAILPLAAVLFYNLYSIRVAKEREVHAEAFRTGQLAALEMQRVLGGLQDTLLSIAAAPAVQSLDPVACNDYMVRIGGRLPQFAGIAVLDGSGVIKCRQEPTGLGVSLADRAYVKDSLAGKFAVGLYSVGRVSKRVVLPVSVPIIDDGGKVIGVVAASLDLKWLDRKVNERSFAVDSNLTVADSNGVILARHPDPERFVGKSIPQQYLHLVESERPGTLELTSQDGTRRILAYFPPSKAQPGLYVSAGISTAEEYASVNTALYYGAAVTAAASLVALLLATLTARYSIRRPVDRLLRTVEAWRTDDGSARTGMSPEQGEFGLLGFAIDSYMDELIAARGQKQRDEEQRKVLTQELDHRVKNLLATVQSVARQSFKSTEVGSAALESFNQRLAAMGEAHALLMRDGWQSASLFDIVRTSIGPFDVSEPSRFKVAGPDLVMHSRAALALGMALHELCTNAAKYGALKSDDGRVDIRWQTVEQEAGSALVFHWREFDGPAVVPPERSGFGSTMIERMLARQLEGLVEVRYESDGLRFQLKVPLSNIELRA